MFNWGAFEQSPNLQHLDLSAVQCRSQKNEKNQGNLSLDESMNDKVKKHKSK